jgi:hypothetical protein
MSISPLFEAAFSARETRDSGGLWDVLDALEAAVCTDPRGCGEPHPSFPAGNMWVYESPALERIPRTFILYEIDDERGRVVLWNFLSTDRP